jgi:hypothetical protein
VLQTGKTIKTTTIGKTAAQAASQRPLFAVVAPIIRAGTAVIILAEPN